MTEQATLPETGQIRAGEQITASDIRDALDGRYAQKRTGNLENESWITIPEARSGAGFAGNRRQCDYLAVSAWQSRGLQLIGHEIKVSRSDWNRELQDPSKAEEFARYCRRWWVVVPSNLGTKIKDEVPPAWGLLSLSKSGGSLREIIPAPAREPDPVPAWWWIGWMAQLDRREKRRNADEFNRAVATEVEKQRLGWERTYKSTDSYRTDNLDRREETLRQIEEVVGFSLTRAYQHDVARLRTLWQASHSGVDLTSPLDALERAVERMREAVAAVSQIDEVSGA